MSAFYQAWIYIEATKDGGETYEDKEQPIPISSQCSREELVKILKEHGVEDTDIAEFEEFAELYEREG